jgi:SAM-dependent methyltransferase
LANRNKRRAARLTQETAEMARAAFRRVGVQQGWHAIDCGCGPVGGLAVMAEMVGPGGRVVGVDFNEAAVQQARAVASALGLGNVEVVAGDIHDLEPATMGGLFDLAYTRLFLMHQANPVRTLRQIAALLRPGGWLVAQEPLRTPPRGRTLALRRSPAIGSWYISCWSGLGCQPEASRICRGPRGRRVLRSPG